MTRKGLFTCIGAAFVALAETGWGQKAPLNWRAYKMADGLPDVSCVSVTVSLHGKVVVKHFNASNLSELDGYTLNLFPAPASKNRVYESPGGQLWTVSPEGLEDFQDNVWASHPVPEIAAAFRAGLAHVIDPIPLYPVRQGLVLMLLPDQFLAFNAEAPEHPRVTVLRTAAQSQLEKFLGLTPARDGGLWIAGARGLAKVPGPVRGLRPESDWREYLVPPALPFQALQEPHEDEDGGVTTLAESTNTHLKVIIHFDGQRWTSLSPTNERPRLAWHGPDQTIWASTIDGLFQWDEIKQELVENHDISARQYFDIAVEPSGIFWLATSDGLFRYAPLTWRTPKSVQKINGPIQSMAEDPESRLWFISGGHLHCLDNDRHQEFSLKTADASGLEETHALFPLRDGTLLLGDTNQWFQFLPRSGNLRPFSLGENRRSPRILGILKDGSLCLQIPTASDSDGYRLERCDGRRVNPLPEGAPERVLGTNLESLYAAQKGDLWLSGERGTAWYHDKKWRTFTSTDKSTPEGALGFTELPDSKIWCATADKIWEFNGRNWSVLRGGFSAIGSLLRARDGSVWVASKGGLHRFFQGAWVENSLPEGLPDANVRSVLEDQRGRLWVGTMSGLSLYHPEADLDAPRTEMPSPTENQKNIPEGGTISLTFDGIDKWKYTPRQRLLFSYRLDDRDWSPFQETNSVAFTDLPAGKHYFQVRAMDRNCNIDPKPAPLEFAVILPWYQERRLVLISFAGLATAVLLGALAFNRHRLLRRSYAVVEKKIAERTRELELANRELVHSQKMNALGTLAAGIAHDFNNILSIVKGSAQVIEDNLDNPDKVRTRVDRIKTVVEQGAGIVKAMLGFSRSSDEQPGLCDLNSVAQDTIKLLGDRFLREVVVSLEPGSDLPPVPGSKDFIQQILLNFIFNAAESMAKRKQIILSTRWLEKLPDGPVLMPSAAAVYVAISVRDFGCGISADTMPRIFEPFFTTKAMSVRRGTGLGLSMVYELARKMEAGLAVESVVDEGSTFTLILPVKELSV